MVMAYIPSIEIDRHPFARGGSVAICMVSLMHLTQAYLLLRSGLASNATSLAALVYASRWVDPDDGRHLLAAILFCTASLALIGAFLRLGWIRMAIFLPQHFLLTVMMIGCMAAAWHGAYLDGTVKPWQHIAADQMTIVALWLVHASAIVRRARDPNG